MSENFNDPLNRGPRPIDETPVYLTRQEANEEGGTMWGWIAGIAVLALVAAFIFGGSNTSQMADQGSGAVPGVTRSTQAPSGSLPSGSLPSGSLQPVNPSATPNTAAPSTTGLGDSTTGSGSNQ